jgi:hypothetical protein
MLYLCATKLMRRMKEDEECQVVLRGAGEAAPENEANRIG